MTDEQIMEAEHHALLNEHETVEDDAAWEASRDRSWESKIKDFCDDIKALGKKHEVSWKEVMEAITKCAEAEDDE